MQAHFYCCYEAPLVMGGKKPPVACSSEKLSLLSESLSRAWKRAASCMRTACGSGRPVAPGGIAASRAIEFCFWRIFARSISSAAREPPGFRSSLTVV